VTSSAEPNLVVVEKSRSSLMRQLASASDVELTKLYEELLRPDAEEAPRVAGESDLILPMTFRLDDGRLANADFLARRQG
jgi:hypothetical protein